MRKSILFIFIISPIFSATIASAQRCYSKVVNFDNEKIINVNALIAPPEEMVKRESQFRSSFKLNDSTELDASPEVISIGKMIEKMYPHLIDGMKYDQGCKDGKCLAMVRLSYGLAGNDITIVYQAFYTRLQPTSTDDSLHYKWMVMTPLNYIYKGSGQAGDFIQISDDDHVALVRRYADNIMKQPSTDSETPAKHLEDSYDMRDVFFSFQEILNFYQAVHAFNSHDKYYCEELEIHHGCIFTQDRLNEPANAKHILFFTKRNWNKLLTKKADKSQLIALTPFVNDNYRPRLCLPRCNDFRYPAVP